MYPEQIVKNNKIAMRLIEAELSYQDGQWSKGVEMLLQDFALTDETYNAPGHDGYLEVQNFETNLLDRYQVARVTRHNVSNKPVLHFDYIESFDL